MEEERLDEIQRQYQRMLAAIGQVSVHSARASRQLQQLVAMVAGTDLAHLMLEDLTLGAQVKHAQAVLTMPNDKFIGAAHLEPEVRDLAVYGLTTLATLTTFRNRVIHDHWYPDPTDEWPDGLKGMRPTRFSRATIYSSVRAFLRLGEVIGTTSALLSSVWLAVPEWRPAPEGTILARYPDLYPPGSSIPHTRTARGLRDKLEALFAQMESGGLPGWRWDEVPWRPGPERE